MPRRSMRFAREMRRPGKSAAGGAGRLSVRHRGAVLPDIADSLGRGLRRSRAIRAAREIAAADPGRPRAAAQGVPARRRRAPIQLALADPLNPQTAEDLRFALGKEIQVVVAPVYQIEDLIRKHYGTDAGSMDEILAQLGGEVEFGGADGDST